MGEARKFSGRFLQDQNRDVAAHGKATIKNAVDNSFASVRTKPHRDDSSGNASNISALLRGHDLGVH